MNLLPMIEMSGKNSEAPAAARSPNMSVNMFPHQAGFGPAFPKEAAQKKTDIRLVIVALYEN